MNYIVYLDRRGFGVLRHLDVGLNDWCQGDLLEGLYALGHVVSGRLHRDILVPVEVDARWSVAGAEELKLQPLVARLRFRPVVRLVAPAAVVPPSASTTASAPTAVVPAAVVPAVVGVLAGRLLPPVVGRQGNVPTPTVTVTPAAAAATIKQRYNTKTVKSTRQQKTVKI